MELKRRYTDNWNAIESLYHHIKPLVSCKHSKEQDIRPLDDEKRRRKWERIKKINDNCYALLDGYSIGDDVFPPWYITSYAPSLEDTVQFSPIVWTRKKNTVSVKVRNGSGGGAHTQRYQFLASFLPRELSFILRNGKQYIFHVDSGKEFYLAKSRSVCSGTARFYENAYGDNPPSWLDGWLNTKDDNAAITFTFDLKSMDLLNVKGGKNLPKPARVAIDKSAKAAMKTELEAFREWAFTIFPILPVDDYDYDRKILNEVYEHIGARIRNYRRGYNEINDVFQKDDLARDIICDPKHPLRLNLAQVLLGSTSYHEECLFPHQQKELAKTVRSQYNARINTVCNFKNVTKGEEI